MLHEIGARLLQGAGRASLSARAVDLLREAFPPLERPVQTVALAGADTPRG
jgi:hypothetical protein